MIAALRPLAVAMLTALLLASCTDEPRPRFEEPTETPSPSASTSSAAAEKEPWEEKSKLGAVAFAEYWIETFNAAARTGETDTLAAVSTSGCGTCRSVIQRLEATYASGGFFEGEGYKVLYATPQPIDAQGRSTVVLRIKRAAERFKNSADSPVKSNPPSKASYNAEIRWRTGSWAMEDLVVFN